MHGSYQVSATGQRVTMRSQQARQLTPGLTRVNMNLDREDAPSMVTAGATANTTEGNSRASRESGLLWSHLHGAFIDRLCLGTCEVG